LTVVLEGDVVGVGIGAAVGRGVVGIVESYE